MVIRSIMLCAIAVCLSCFVHAPWPHDLLRIKAAIIIPVMLWTLRHWGAPFAPAFGALLTGEVAASGTLSALASFCPQEYKSQRRNE